tara:strand:+ start:372 stop:575 length:204 start_codon:yes stop_codon:yes gene_type:complete
MHTEKNQSGSLTAPINPNRNQVGSLKPRQAISDTPQNELIEREATNEEPPVQDDLHDYGIPLEEMFI